MTMNIHTKTGIAFGVVYALDLPYLYDEILQNGTDNNYESAKQEIVEQLKSCETAEEANAVVDEHHYSDVYHVEDMDFECEDLAGELMETWEDDSHNVDYEDGEYKYHLTMLGGAPLIYILESPFVATCRPCSPCCPNAGDLNNITDVNGGNVAYCFNPEDYKPDSEDANKPSFVIDNETTPPTISLTNESIPWTGHVL